MAHCFFDGRRLERFVGGASSCDIGKLRVCSSRLNSSSSFAEKSVSLSQSNQRDQDLAFRFQPELVLFQRELVPVPTTARPYLSGSG